MMRIFSNKILRATKNALRVKRNTSIKRWYGASIPMSKYECSETDLTISLSNEMNVRLSSFEARDNCCCDLCKMYPSRHRSPECDVLTTDMVIKSHNISETNSNIINISWSDNHNGCIDTNQIIKDYDFKKYNTNDVIAWNKNNFNVDESSCVDYNELMNDNIALQYLYNQFDTYGIVRIKNGPIYEGVINDVGKRICNNLYPTMHGEVFTVETHESAINPAFTDQKLWVHTDLCHLHNMPDYFLFHCINNEIKDTGNSVYTDGFNIANIMNNDYNYYYNLLTQYKVPFRENQDNWDFYDEKYIIELNNYNQLNRIHFNEGTRYSLNWNIDNDIKKDIYYGIKIFQKLAHDESNQINFWMNPGEITLFNNRRLLHGRQQIKGKRKFQGAYILEDHFKAKQRALKNTV